MALATHGRRRSRQQAQRARRRRRRLRRRVPRAGSHVARRCRRKLQRPRRGNAREAGCATKQRRGAGASDQGGPRGRRSGRLGDTCAAHADRYGAADRLRRQGSRSNAVPDQIRRAVAQRSADRASGRRPRTVLDQPRTRRHRASRARRHDGAGRAGAVAVGGNPPRRGPLRRHPCAHR